MKHDIAVMASGKGSNLQVILQAIGQGECAARVAVVIVNKADAGALQIAKDAGVPHYFIDPQAYQSREAYDMACAEVIRRRDASLLFWPGICAFCRRRLFRLFRSELSISIRHYCLRSRARMLWAMRFNTELRFRGVRYIWSMRSWIAGEY